MRERTFENYEKRDSLQMSLYDKCGVRRFRHTPHILTINAQENQATLPSLMSLSSPFSSYAPHEQ